MTCSPVKLNGLSVIVCHRGKRMEVCHICGEIAGYACDWKVGQSGETCDAPMCKKHRSNVGEDRDLCFRHMNAWRNHPNNPNRDLKL